MNIQNHQCILNHGSKPHPLSISASIWISNTHLYTFMTASCGAVHCFYQRMEHWLCEDGYWINQAHHQTRFSCGMLPYTMYAHLALLLVRSHCKQGRSPSSTSYSDHTHPRTQPSFCSQLRTCTDSSLYTAVTQTYKNLANSSKPLQYMSPAPGLAMMTCTHPQLVWTIRATLSLCSFPLL